MFSESRNGIKLQRSDRFGPLKSVLIGIAVGIPLAAVNVLGAVGGRLELLSLNDPISPAFRALSPGISEEVIFRFCLYAFCLCLVRDDLQQGAVRILCLVTLVVPHVLLHLPDLLLISPAEAVASFAMLSLLFGLPMALLQLRRNLVSAMSLHWFIDFVRFMMVSV
ncbi:MAG: CPBP family glutamic-type intramembrane protease [Bacillota bacterium]